MPGRKLDRIRRFRELGAARLTMGPPGFDKQSITDGLGRFVDEIVSKL